MHPRSDKREGWYRHRRITCVILICYTLTSSKVEELPFKGYLDEEKMPIRVKRPHIPGQKENKFTKEH